MPNNTFGGDMWDTLLTTPPDTPPIFSNENFTASANGASYVQNITPQTSGRWYSELQVTYSGNATDSLRIGVTSTADPYLTIFTDYFLGSSLFLTSKGNVVFGDYIGNGKPFNSGDIICIATNFDANRVWFRINDGPWDDLENTTDSAADPYAVVGGSDISAYAGQYHYIGVLLTDASSVNIGPLQYMPPVGYNVWLNPTLYDLNNVGILPLPKASGIINAADYSLTTNGGVNGAGVFLPSPYVNTSNNGTNIYAFNPYDIQFPYSICGAQARVNMFDMPIVVNLVLTVSCTGNPVLMNYPINRTDFRLVRGVPNSIQFFVRDVDRHIAAGPLANATLTINIVDTNAGVLLLQRELYTVNAATCLYGLSTQPIDMLNWPTGYLQYSVLVKRADGTESLLWTDRNYSPYGYLTMTDGPLPGPAQPTILDPTTFIADTGYNYSTALPGAAAKGYPDGMQTFTFYTDNYTANVIIQASLVEQPSTDLQDWFTVTTQNFYMTNGATAVNLEGNYLWLRVAVPNTNPVPYPGIPPLLTYGNVSQITYLN